MRKNEKQQLVSLDNTIKKSNDFALSKMKKGLTILQFQLFSFAIYSTQKNGKTSFSKAEFEQFFGLSKYNTKEASSDAEKLMDLKISMEDLSNDNFKYWNVFSTIEYDRGTFEFTWNEAMLPNILELKRNYVLLDLMTTNNFVSSYSWKFYEYLKAKHGYWTLEFKREELYKLFAIEDSISYVRNSAMFKKRVLEPVIEDLNNSTEFKIAYVEKRKGKKITGYEFTWSKGDVVKLASKKQIDELQKYINTLLEDMLLVFDLPDEQRLEGLDILKEIRELQKTINYSLLETEVSLKREILKKGMKRFHELCGQQNSKNPGFYNWLDEREESEEVPEKELVSPSK